MDLFNYHGLDWFAMTASFMAVYSLGNKNKVGFIFFICSNFVWVYVGYLAESPAIMTGNAISLLLNFRSLALWYRRGLTKTNET
ncbi:MAG: PnuC protein [Bacteroidota bacterium]